MENPAAESLMEMVRKINQIAKGTRPSEPEVEDYLRAIASDPTTQWFTELLREKNLELSNERQRADELACALRNWYRAKDTEAREAESRLVDVLRAMKIVSA